MASRDILLVDAARSVPQYYHQPSMASATRNSYDARLVELSLQHQPVSCPQEGQVGELI